MSGAHRWVSLSIWTWSASRRRIVRLTRGSRQEYAIGSVMPAYELKTFNEGFRFLIFASGRRCSSASGCADGQAVSPCYTDVVLGA